MQFIEGLRKLTKQIQDCRIARDNENIKQALMKYDEALERYIPVLMAQVRRGLQQLCGSHYHP